MHKCHNVIGPFFLINPTWHMIHISKYDMVNDPHKHHDGSEFSFLANPTWHPNL
jgi:hypothetical protein